MGVVTTFQSRPVLAGEASGEALASHLPLSFWGGFDPDTGEIIDQRHPLAGHIATKCVLVIPSGRGSCSGSGVLLEAIRNGTAPAAIITSQLDPIIALGGILGDECYGSHPVIVLIPESHRQQIATGHWLSINQDGHVTVEDRL